jgi:hypothetical protein
MIYTSNFSKIPKLAQSNMLDRVFPIVRFLPEYCPSSVASRNLEFLAPSKELLMGYKEGRVSWEDYKVEYLKQLSDERIKKNLIKLAESERSFILICYCGAGKPCHRHIITEFLNHLGYGGCSEWVDTSNQF